MRELTYEEIKPLLLEVVAKMTEEEVRDFHEAVSEEVAKLSGQISELTRDEVVATAKEDIRALAMATARKGPAYSTPTGNGDTRGCFADFIINKEKRVIVALMRGYYDEKVYAKGIAKCAPADCFNEYIGKTIALRRALRRSIPDIYTNAPQPEGVEVGDKITLPNGVGTYKVLGEKSNKSYLLERFNGSRYIIPTLSNATVVDDSARYKEEE